MSADIPSTVGAVREYFESGQTRAAEWRRAQLMAMQRMLVENKQRLCEALHKDLGKSDYEAYFFEIHICLTEIKGALRELNRCVAIVCIGIFTYPRVARRWMQPEPVSLPVIVVPGRAYIKPEPYGVCLILGPFNYPIQLLLLPLAGAIAAGNCAVLKPSEMCPETAVLVSELIPLYLDRRAFAVVQVRQTSRTPELT
jgi:aldehyde dehydrogenase (NAD+)